MTAKQLKESTPLYPAVKRTLVSGEVVFTTLIRKAFKGEYYLYTLTLRGVLKDEAKVIHQLHSSAYRFFMLSRYDAKMFTLDEDQENEIIRLERV